MIVVILVQLSKSVEVLRQEKGIAAHPALLEDLPVEAVAQQHIYII